MVTFHGTERRTISYLPGTTGDEILGLLKRPRWHADAACKGKPPEWFFPERGADVRPARAVCATCTVVSECRQAGIDGREHGIWGGTSARERRALLGSATAGAQATAKTAS